MNNPQSYFDLIYYIVYIKGIMDFGLTFTLFWLYPQTNFL